MDQKFKSLLQPEAVVVALSSLSAKNIMPNPTFLPPGNIADHHLTPNSYPSLLPTYMVDQNYSSNCFPGLELFDYLAFDDHPPISEHSIYSFSTASPSILRTPLTSHDIASSGSSASASSFDGMPMNNHMQMRCKREIKKAKEEEVKIVAFRTRTELQTLDDGYKWRKYGKKMVKSNSNPRHYYKCSSVGCKVKKRTERDTEDSSYLLTTYEGVHNHEIPYIIYYDELPLALF